MNIICKNFKRLSFLLVFFMSSSYAKIEVETNECDNWQSKYPEWIFCDDFESSEPLVNEGRYFEANTNPGKFELVNTAGINNSFGMRAIWQIADVNVGDLKLSFGRNPVPYMNKNIRNQEDFREVYYRMFLKMQDNWQGNPEKLSRATVIAKSNWGQAMSANTWQGSDKQLGIDPTSCIYTIASTDVVTCEGYNDFSQRYFLGYKSGTTPIFETSQAGQWQCVEVHIKLNDAGMSNGIQEFWVNDNLEASSTNLDFVGTYNDYAINAVFFENYWNAGSPKNQERYFDNIVVSTERIGCKTATTAGTNTEPALTDDTSSDSSEENGGSGTLNLYALLLLLLLIYKRRQYKIK